MISPAYVFDTNVLVAAFRSRRGASFEILRRLVDGEISGVVSNTLMTEYEAVLTRANLLAAGWAGVNEINAVLDLLAKRLTEVVPRYRWRPMLQDPDDDMVLECAVNAGAEGIVTLNTADFLPVAEKQFGLVIRRPGDYLQHLGSHIAGGERK